VSTNHKTYVVSVIATIGALLMHIPHVVQILLLLMALSLVLEAIVCATKRCRCRYSLWGELAKRAATMVLLTALGASEPVLGVNALDYSAVFFVVYELILITENAARLGVPVPDRLREMLATLRGRHNGQNSVEFQSNTQNSR
jgi:phage-related holin